MNARTAQAWIASLALCLAGSALAGPQASGDASAAPPVVAYAALPEMWLEGGELRGMELWLHVDLAKGEVTQGDRGSRAIDCSGAGWSCISVPTQFDLAVRDDWEIPPPAWEYQGVKYRFAGDLDHAVLGRDASGHVICAESVTRNELARTFNACFLYNRARGVIAITLYEGKFGGPKRIEYIAAGEQGLFAAVPPVLRNEE